MGSPEKWPGETDAAHPEVFTIPPVPYTEPLKPGQLNQDQFKQFWEEGYVIIPDIIPRVDLNAAKEDIKILVDNLAQRLYKAGKTKDLYRKYGFYQRLIMIEKDFPGANIVLHKQGVLTENLQNLLAHEKLLNVAEQILGTSDIMANPVWNLRTKTPKNEPTTVPWHQDVAYCDNDSYDMMVVTAWVPLLDVKEWNGCMQMARRGHVSGKVAKHTCCHGGTWYVSLDEKEMEQTLGVNLEEDLVVCEVPYGGAMFFNNLIPHRSLNNFSNDVRWSLDLRWHAAGKPAGFHGLKEGLQVRSSTDPEFKIDWATFNNADRHSAAFEAMGQTAEEFDTTIPGPWMKKWEIVHMNQHTEALKAQEESGQSGTSWHGGRVANP